MIFSLLNSLLHLQPISERIPLGHDIILPYLNHCELVISLPCPDLPDLELFVEEIAFNHEVLVLYLGLQELFLQRG